MADLIVLVVFLAVAWVIFNIGLAIWGIGKIDDHF